MGHYFVMSMRFNKTNATDFGLVDLHNDTAHNPRDGTIWKKMYLYDFGWGKEIGYAKTPLPNFEELVKIALESEDEEDRFGCVAVLLDYYSEELLAYCEKIAAESGNIRLFKRLVELFGLRQPLNRCPSVGKSFSEVRNMYARWKKLANLAQSV